MSNTMKTLIFIISLFIFLFFFIIVKFIIPPQLILNSPYAVFFTAALYITGYIAALYSQALMKYFYARNLMKNLTIIKILPVKFIELRDKLILLTLPIIAVLMPMVSKRAVTIGDLWSLAFLSALALILEILFLINSRTIRVHVTNKGFAILGMDFRLELSVPFSYTNAVGWYPFERIESYLAAGNKVFLYHTYDLGVITFECSEEEVRQIKGLLVSNKVPERRY